MTDTPAQAGTATPDPATVAANAMRVARDAQRDARQAAYRMRGDGATYAAVADALGVSERTARLWFHAVRRADAIMAFDEALRRGTVTFGDRSAPIPRLASLDDDRIADARQRGWDPIHAEAMLAALADDPDLLWSLCDELGCAPDHLVPLLKYERDALEPVAEPDPDFPNICREYLPRLFATGVRGFDEIRQVVDDCDSLAVLDQRLAAIDGNGRVFCRLIDLGCYTIGVETGFRAGVLNRRNAHRLARQLETMTADERRAVRVQIDGWLHGCARRPRLPDRRRGKKSHREPGNRRGDNQRV